MQQEERRFFAGFQVKVRRSDGSRGGSGQGFQLKYRRDGYPESLPSFSMFGSLRQSSVKATIGAGGAFVEDGDYVATSGHSKE